MFNTASVAIEFFLLRGNVMRFILETDAKTLDTLAPQNEQLVVNLRQDLQKMGSNAHTPEAQQTLTSASALVDRYLAGWQVVEPLARQQKKADAWAYYQKNMTPVSNEIKVLLPEARARRLAEQLQSASDLNATVAQGSAQLRWLCLGTMLCGTLAAFFIIRGINHMLRETVHSLDLASGQIASASEVLAQGASEQAATIEETSSASTEINSMAQRNTENARTTNDLVIASQTRFEETNQSLAEMVEAMDGITSSSHKISKIIKVIDEIAFQTNILALNAAVEAARAGDAGMGFAVVADEVRSLAQRSAKAARDTAELIEESIERSQGGKRKVDLVASNIRAVTAESAKIKVLVDEINLGSVEQSRGIDQIARSISDMEQVTQTGAASAQELSANALTMQDVVASLTLMVGSGAPQPSRRASAPSVVAKVKTTVKFNSSKGSHSTGSTRLAAAGSIPMDDDFKAF
jgi:methyl-accepting chemotaxis protein/methyl-accepting chemotaxis protein-1 (serine sensor receptor)